MKRAGRAVWLPWLCLLLAGLAQAGEQGRLWRVEGQNNQVSYLFGTMHSEDPRVMKLPAPVQGALAGSVSLTLEMSLDNAAMMAMAQQMMLPQDQSLRTLIGAELFDKAAVAMAPYGIPEFMLERMKPWSVFLTLSMPPTETGQFLDLSLYQQALQAGKAVYGLETVQEQIDVFDTMPIQDQAELLRESIRQLPELPAYFERMTTLYLKGDLEGLMAMGKESYADMDDGLARRFMTQLIDERNRRMVERMQPRLLEGGAFIAIGALHLPGDEGILSRLKTLGYRIRPVY